MKHLQFLIIIVLITACSGSKSVVNKNPNSHSRKTTEPVAPLTNKPIALKNTQNTPKSETTDVLVKKSETTPNSTPEALNHDLWNELLKKHVTNEGNVSYVGFMEDRKMLSNYISYLGENLPDHTWDVNKTFAYWINTYNAMTIDLILRHYPIQSIKDIKKPWDQRYWKLGKKWYNLNEIEHDILRKMNEPRIHFAIVCASYSCPKLQNEAFTSLNLNQQLTKATQEFLSDSSKNNISENSLELSKIFQWFAKDFKQNGSLIDFLNQYSEVNISVNAKKHFNEYDWSLNH
ncbi:DUF547 domain-containing protein [uncultured Algibacter sp.]|uniref:DUF547 domain-containing protein n=1 Tax=uncultured Algibacter sp. TaxID=298659 RepID=UPI0026083296|nr:DUF547 domain-containing protein [uncultured Algibacter sp.]